MEISGKTWRFMQSWVNQYIYELMNLGRLGHGDLIFFHIMYYTTSIFLNINTAKLGNQRVCREKIKAHRET